MDIPYQLLSAGALRGIIDDFVLREGTDYGPQEHTIEEKRYAVERQLNDGTAKIVFNAKAGDCNIVKNEPRSSGDKCPK